MSPALLTLNFIALHPGGETRQHQLTELLRARILDGRLRAGVRLPSSRALRRTLGVGRNTVLGAYEQLAAEGYVSGRRGSGTYVTDRLPDARLRATRSAGPLRPQAPAAQPTSARATAVPSPSSAPVFPAPFRPCVPSSAEFPLHTWEMLRRRVLARSGTHLLHYAEPVGYQPLRESIAAHVQDYRGVRCDSGQVIVTAGAQQAFSLIFSALAAPVDPVWMEDPGYGGFRSAAAAARRKVIPLPVDEEGIALPRRARRQPALIYVTPSRQFPLGITMSLRRRLELLAFADRSGSWIIEDDYDSEHRYSGRPLPALQGLQEKARVLYVGTFSKTVFPALRLGYIVAPPALVDGLARARAALDSHSPSLDQAVLAEFLQSGAFGRHLRRTQTLYGERLEVFRSEMERLLGGRVRLDPAVAGLSLVGRLPEGADDAAWCAKAAAAGIEAQPLSGYRVRAATPPAAVFGFAPFIPAAIRRGVQRLASAWGPLANR